MNAIIYPIHFRRNFEQRWAARMVREEPRRPPMEATDTCTCGHGVIAPSRSTCAPSEIVNQSDCPACGKRWETTAPGRDDGC